MAELQQNVDTYMTPGLEQQVIYKTSGLLPGTHTFTVETTGTANPPRAAPGSGSTPLIRRNATSRRASGGLERIHTL